MKDHLQVLDGLRGIAALSVVICHFQSTTVALAKPDMIWFRHAHLAVDFFYCLSGYVIAYAYDARRPLMTAGKFLLIRLIRLHPMVLFGISLGFITFINDPFAFRDGFPEWGNPQPEPMWKAVAALAGGSLVIPTWPLPYRLESYFPLNTPMWSLMWEYLASIAYGIILWRLSIRPLMIITGIAAVLLAFAAYRANDLNIGWGWGQELGGFARTAFSFSIGLLLCRLRVAIPAKLGFIALSTLLVIVYLVPVGSDDTYNWVYESFLVIVIFPLIVALGAGAKAAGRMSVVCDFLGRISYPIYLINFPIIMLFMGYYWTVGIDPAYENISIALMVLATAAFSYGVLVLYDEPVRAWLKRANMRNEKPLNNI